MVIIYELKSRNVTDPAYLSLCQLRYEILIKEQNKKVAGSDHLNHTIIDKLDSSSLIYVGEKEGQIIGMIRYTPLNATNYQLLKDDYALEALKECIHFERAFVTTRYLIHPSFRNKKVAFDLIAKASENIFQNLGLHYSIVGSTDVIFKFHSRLGYRRYTDEPILFAEGMFVYPMILDLNDKELLKEAKSPLYRIIHTASSY